MIALLCACLALLPALPDDEVVARAGDVSFGREAYAEWLLETFGHVHLEDYVLEHVIVIEAEARGLRPTEDELEAAFQEERQDLIDDFFSGDEARYIEDKAMRGIDLERHESRRRRTLLSELCLTRMAQAERVIDEAQLEKRYEVMFGDLGERTEVEVLFFSMYHGLRPGDRPDMTQADRDARARAEEARQAWLDGASLDELRPGSDPIASEFVDEGRIAQWRRKLLGNETEQAVNSLDSPGQIAPVVKVWDGYYVLRLVRREPVTYEGVRDELEALERAAEPTTEQLSQTRAGIKERYPAEYFLR